MQSFVSQVAACPVGDLFDALQATCVPTEICGAVTSVTESSPPMPPLERRDPAIEQPMKPEIATEQSEKPEQQPLPETSAPFGVRREPEFPTMPPRTPLFEPSASVDHAMKPVLARPLEAPVYPSAVPEATRVEYGAEPLRRPALASEYPMASPLEFPSGTTEYGTRPLPESATVPPKETGIPESRPTKTVSESALPPIAVPEEARVEYITEPRQRPVFVEYPRAESGYARESPFKPSGPSEYGVRREPEVPTMPPKTVDHVMQS